MNATSPKSIAFAFCPLIFIMATLWFLGGCVVPTQRTQYNELSIELANSAFEIPHKAATPPFTDSDTLVREQLIQQVLTRNPTVETARQAWIEALARYPQVTALTDPMLSYQSAPRTIGSDHSYGQLVQLSQRLEWPGKQFFRGAIAMFDAQARSFDMEGVRLQLRMAASILFDDYFAVGRALQINQKHQEIVTQLRQSAEAQYAAGHAGQKDVIQAEVELALLEREQLTLTVRKQIIISQINGLLHRPAEEKLPAAPTTLERATPPSWEAAHMLKYARQHRPVLRAAESSVEARASGVALSQHAYYPDFSLVVAYNSMWPQIEHQLMLGFSLNIPIQFGARRGGVQEAAAALAKAQSLQAEYQSSVDVEVRQALLQFEEALAQTTIYEEQILPAARRQIEAAEAGYKSGQINFSDIIDAQRQLRRFEQFHAEALADTWRKRAVLTRVVGVALDRSSEGEAP